ncbi:MAG: hypothetical protein JXN60_03310 [Lentisphaerae bacterium]|nr:hypothetical protein [Lentisphaerota bacterium]
MIWDPNAEPRGANDRAVSRIADEIAAICGDEFNISDGNLENVALAVADYLDVCNVATTPGSNNIMMLVSKALSSLGERRAARRLVLLGTGLVSPSAWEVTDNRTMWVLDLKRIAVWNSASLEMVFFRSLHMILDAIADVWDEVDGQGMLGLRHVCATASALQGNKKNAIQGFTEEIRDLCRRKLMQIGQERGWNHAPRVMDLDMRRP